MVDNCSELASQIAALSAQISSLNILTETQVKTIAQQVIDNSKPSLVATTKASLQPHLLTAVAAAGVVATNKLQPQIDAVKKQATDAFLEAVENTKRQRLLEIEAKGTREAATKGEKIAAEYARQMLEAQAETARVAREQARQNRVNRDVELSQAELRELTRHNAQEAERLLGIERKNAAKFSALESIVDVAKADAELAKGLSSQAKNEVVTASAKATNAVTEAATATKAALNASLDANGLKQIVNGIGSRIDGLGRAIGVLESKTATAVANAARAVGISSEALAATGRLAGRILEIFQVIGTIFTIIEQLQTLNILGDRIDAVENGVVALGNDLSRVLGKLLGLQNRIGANETLTAQVKNIALDAKGIGEAANLKAGAAQVTATRAENFGIVANANAKTAQVAADGAVRNAARANENATTAYNKANEAELAANKAQNTAANAEGIGNQAKKNAGEALGKAGQALSVGLTAITLYQTVRFLRGLPGLPGRDGRNGVDGRNGINGAPGVTTIVQIPGTPGRDGLPGMNGRPGINGINGRNGRDVNPADLAGLKAFIAAQHAQTRAAGGALHSATRQYILAPIMGILAPLILICKQILDLVNKFSNAAQLALLNIINNKLGKQVTGGLSQFIETIAKNTYVEKALAVLTFAATIHNAFMLSNNLVQTLGTIIDQVLAFILPKGFDGTPLTIENALGKLAHEIIADTVGEANYKQISEDWAKANRIYQASVNVFNQVGNAVGLVTAGMEVIGGNVAKIGNALKVWGAIGEKAYSWMNPQPNFKGKFFNFINTATAEANTIAMMVAVPIGISAAAIEINSSVGALKKELDQEDPKDAQGHPITDKLGNSLKWEPGVTVPDPTKTVLTQEQAKADSKNIIQATLEDIFDGGD
ncbi:hypothetical protein [Nostoc sp.]|uniref:hypothetical protein n=1 Tax=Nostoc sp. TaxID=1180 RepID=UPI002FFD2684